jgi:hypothetical protein
MAGRTTTTSEDLLAKLSEAIEQAHSLPEGNGRLMVLSYMENIRSIVQSVPSRHNLQATMTDSQRTGYLRRHEP